MALKFITMDKKLRDRYISMRNKKEIDLVILFDYFKQEGGKVLDFNIFKNFIHQIINMGFDINLSLPVMDKHFGVNLLYSKEGELVRVW